MTIQPPRLTTTGLHHRPSPAVVQRRTTSLSHHDDVKDCALFTPFASFPWTQHYIAFVYTLCMFCAKFSLPLYFPGFCCDWCRTHYHSGWTWTFVSKLGWWPIWDQGEIDWPVQVISLCVEAVDLGLQLQWSVLLDSGHSRVFFFQLCAPARGNEQIPSLPNWQLAVCCCHKTEIISVFLVVYAHVICRVGPESSVDPCCE